MSNQGNKTVIHQFVEEVNRKGASADAERFLAADYLDHSAPPGLPPGPEGWRLLRSRLFQALGEVRITVEDMVAEDDKVAVRFTLRAIPTG